MTQLGVEKNPLINSNWPLLVVMLLLAILGMANLYSASAVRMEDGINVASYFQKQILWTGVGLVCMVVFMFFDYRRLSSMAEVLMGLSIGFLLLVLVMGSEGGGARRWLNFGPVSFQPSEAVKISVMILAAKMLAKSGEPMGWADLFKVLAVTAVPTALVLKQPDLGTALIVIFIVGGMILYRGVKRQILKLGIILLVLSPFVVVEFVVPNLHDYQRQRIVGFINPEQASPGALYQNNQSEIAIGSGQAWGKGFLEGTQSKLRFLPAKHTDFAIAVFGEEWGFSGALLLVSLFCLFLLCIQATARDAKDRFGSILAAGIFFYFFWQILINIGMVLGIMPVVGIPLPFISYGGTATIVNFCLVGMVINISVRRFVFKS